MGENSQTLAGDCGDKNGAECGSCRDEFQLMAESGERAAGGLNRLMSRTVPLEGAQHATESIIHAYYQALPMFPCWLIHACMAIPAATETLMLRVDPKWAIETVSEAPVRASSLMPGPS
jgi:hypothetical protein